MKIVVTGGAGFIGSHLSELLVSQGREVLVFDNFSNPSPAFSPKKKNIFNGDVTRPADLKRAFSGATSVCHLAANISVVESVSNPAKVAETNVVGTHNVLKAAADANVQRVVFASSCAVYGDQHELPISESAPPNPLSPYAETKLAGEKLCSSFSESRGLSTIALRIFNVYGPGQSPSGEYAAAIPKFISLSLKGKPHTIFGDGRQTRDFVYVGDVARAFALAVSARISSGSRHSALNIGSGVQTEILGLSTTIGGLLKSNKKPEFAKPREGEILRSCGEISKAKKILGWSPEVSLKDGLAKTIESYSTKTKK